jgi:meiotic recombination protein SPO11
MMRKKCISWVDQNRLIITLIHGFGTMLVKSISTMKMKVYLGETIKDVFATTRSSLNVRVLPKGYIYDQVVLYIINNIHIDPRLDPEIIPDNSTLIDRIEATGMIEFILVIEKGTIFFMLTRLNFARKHHCVIITGRVYADIATRVVVHKLSDRFIEVPVFGLSYLDAHGLGIIVVYKFGSYNRSFDNLDLVV